MELPFVSHTREIDQLNKRDDHTDWKPIEHKHENIKIEKKTATKRKTPDKSCNVETIVVVPELNVGLQSEDEEPESRQQDWNDHQSNQHPLQVVPVKVETPISNLHNQMMQKCFEDCKIATETLNNCKAEEVSNSIQPWTQPVGHIDPSDKVYTPLQFSNCPTCNFTSPDAKEIKQHLSTHFIEKTYNCKVCGVSCAGPWKLKRHMQVHSNDKLHCCDMCDYSCSEAWRLKRHVKVHMGDKSHSCAICGYTGPDSWKLKRHMRIHTGEKPYSCSCCDYCSSDSWKVKRHMRVHTSKKTF
uniref:C2H2-type domain-containing protein n=1 Tax=Clastoptera arizonana TaxID=38151 RepID=A0A1B6C7G8_9HEMI